MENNHENARKAVKGWIKGLAARLLAPGTGLGSLYMLEAWMYVIAEVYHNPKDYAKTFEAEVFTGRKANVSGIYDNQKKKDNGGDTQK